MKIFFKSLKAKNAWSYKELSLDFIKKGLTIVQGVNKDDGGSNGSGKSAIPRLFFYGLTGVTPDDLKTDNLLPDFHPRNLEVSVNFSIGQDDYTVTRYRAHSDFENKLILTKNGRDITRKNAVDTQREIMTILGLSRENLLLLTLFSVDTISFAKATPSARRALFLDLFPLIEYYSEEIAPRFKKLMNACEEELSTLKEKLITLHTKQEFILNTKDTITKDMQRLQSEVAVLKEKRSQRAEAQEEERVVKEINDLTRAFVEQFSEKIVSNMHKLPEISKKLSREIHGLRSEKDLLEVERRSHITSQTTAEGAFLRACDELTDLQNQKKGEICKHCKSIIQTTADPKEIEEKNLEVLRLKKEVERARTAAQTVADLQNKLTSQIHALESKLEKIHEAEDFASRITALKKEQSEISVKMLQDDEKISKVEQELERLASMLRDNTHTLEDLNKEEKELLDTRGRLTDKATKYAYLRQISLVDIPTYLLNHYIKILEEKATEILRQLFGGMRIILGDTATTKKGVDRAELTLHIEKSNGVVKEYRTLSGGERQAVDISLLFGIQRMVADETGVVSNILFLDEVLDISADAVRSQAILEFIHRVSVDYDSVFLISHKSTLMERSDTILTVTKENLISSLTEEKGYSMHM